MEANVVAVEEEDRNELEDSSVIAVACSVSSKEIADPVVYKLARVVGDGIYIPATDDDMKAEDLIDHKSSLHLVLDNNQTAVGSSNDDPFDQEFAPIDCEFEELLKFEDPSTQGERSEAVVDTSIDLGKLNPKFEEVTRSESTPLDGQIDQSGVRKLADPLVGPAENEPSTSNVCASWKPDFSMLKGEICLDNLSVRELHATFEATFGRETSVKDKQWLKRRISMGLCNSCDGSATTFIIENSKVKRKDNVEDCNSEDKSHNKDPVTGLEGRNVSELVGHNQTIQMEGHFSGGSKTLQSASPKHHIAFEDDNQRNKRVRKPTKRYIEVSESDSQEHSGRLVSAVKSSGSGSRTRVRPVHNIQPVRKPLVTRQDSLGGSGVEIPYVSRIRRGRPRENVMALMNFQPCGVGMTAELVKEAHDGHNPQSDEDIENQEHKATTATEWLQHPLIKESGENEQYSEQSEDVNINSDDGHMDSYADIDSDDNILTVPTAKGGMRRKHHRPWTLSEVAKLVEGVSRYGAGKWSEIKKIAFAACSHRTSVDLKDKWRNLLRASFAQLPAEKGVQNFKKQSSTPIPAPILLRVRELAEMQSQVSPDLKAVKFASNNINDMKSGFL
ncbi:hypothetical protein QVD17_29962 [Tagetes erecta]|uniref:Uncharacterized protein n=1 Tax=Tagetes erecta TaxID=13708 RepID=A0AAD8K6Z9_TARER|nr:hypothetical protein QVD17_29962 [Tagetes erecta]